MINLDTNSAIAFVSEGSNVRYQLKAFVQNQPLVMAQTAFDEFVSIIHYSGGFGASKSKPISQASHNCARSSFCCGSSITTTRGLDPNDIIILGTGDQMGIVTTTADAKAIRAAGAQGVSFNVYLHLPYPLIGS